MVEEEVEDPLCVPALAARSPGPGDTLRHTWELLRLREGEPCWESRFSQPCSSRVGLGRASTARQDAARLVAAQMSFALDTDDFDNGRAMRMLEALGCFSDSAWAGVY